MRLRKCPKCGRYTLLETCPVCGNKTVPAHPIVSGKWTKYACDYVIKNILKRFSDFRPSEHS